MTKLFTVLMLMMSFALVSSCAHQAKKECCQKDKMAQCKDGSCEMKKKACCDKKTGECKDGSCKMKKDMACCDKKTGECKDGSCDLKKSKS